MKINYFYGKDMKNAYEMYHSKVARNYMGV